MHTCQPEAAPSQMLVGGASSICPWWRVWSCCWRWRSAKTSEQPSSQLSWVPASLQNTCTGTQMCAGKTCETCLQLLGKRSMFSPLGMSSMTSLGKAMLEQPTSAPHTRTHSSGSTHPTVSETWRRGQQSWERKVKPTPEFKLLPFKSC